MLKYFLSSHLWQCCYMAFTDGLTIFTPWNKREDGLLISVLLLKYMFSGQTFNFEALENTLEWLSSVCGRGEMEREETYGISLPSYVAYFFLTKMPDVLLVSLHRTLFKLEGIINLWCFILSLPIAWALNQISGNLFINLGEFCTQWLSCVDNIISLRDWINRLASWGIQKRHQCFKKVILYIHTCTCKSCI